MATLPKPIVIEVPASLNSYSSDFILMVKIISKITVATKKGIA